MTEKPATRRDSTDGASDRTAEPGSGPGKQEGDALLTGTGTRHGVQKADERPVTREDEGREEG
jgi:hypothetical protein